MKPIQLSLAIEGSFVRIQDGKGREIAVVQLIEESEWLEDFLEQLRNETEKEC